MTDKEKRIDRWTKLSPRELLSELLEATRIFAHYEVLSELDKLNEIGHDTQIMRSILETHFDKPLPH